MPGAGSPAAVGRTHALHRIVEHIEDLVAGRPIPKNAAPEDAEYLRAFAATCRSIADRLRRSPCYTVEDR